MRPPWPAATMFLAITAASAASPPGLLNYQGVLRDASDAPLSGTYDMVFRFYSLAAGGDHILTDFHKALNGGAVTVDGGLFNVQLGGGSIVDGAGPGTYSDLASVFRDYAEVWLEVEVQSETLSPRTRIVGAAYALNATNLGGRPGSYYLDTSSTAQTKSGALTVDAAPSPGQATLATGNWGIRSFGAYDGSGLTGPAAGYFQDTAHTGTAYLGHGDTGVEGYGTWAGGVFRNGSTSGYTDEALLAYSDYGIQARGDTAGGYFKDTDQTGEAFLGEGDTGVAGYGAWAGGVFRRGSPSSYAEQAVLANAGIGVTGYGGNWAGYFEQTYQNDYGTASVAGYGYGISALGSIASPGGGAGGVFQDDVYSGYAEVASGDTGIVSGGTYAGGIFRHGTWSSWDIETYLSSATAGLQTNGAKNFVQNHPYEKDRLVAYASLEGDEVGTYTRGSGRLENGVARVRLGETFEWVTNPDIGLTAHLTPRGEAVPLAVESLTTTEMVVRGPAGGPDVAFDYVVHGLRIGFERSSVVREKDVEAFIPDMAPHEGQYARHPELARFSALERFAAMAASLGTGAPPDLSRAEALKAAVGVFDPANPPLGVSRVLTPENEAELAAAKAAGTRPVGNRERAEPMDAREARRAKENAVPADGPGVSGTLRARSSGEASPPLGFPPLAAPVSVGLSVEAGDLLANDPVRPGVMTVAHTFEDPGVVGIVAGDPGSTWTGVAPIALAGSVVFCKVDATDRPIAPNDLLVASPTPGHAMRAGDEPRQGTIVAKALEPLDAGTGLIRVLVMPR